MGNVVTSSSGYLERGGGGEVNGMVTLDSSAECYAESFVLFLLVK